MSRTQRCKSCELDLPFDRFSPDITRKTGFRETCKTCRNQQYRERAARKKALVADSMADPPEGYAIKGTSTLYDAEGNITQQWVKTDKERVSALQAQAEALETLASPYEGLAIPKPPPRHRLNSGACMVYPMGDPHCGLHAWAKETGAAFDLDIFRSNLYAAVDELVALAPATEVAIIGHVGDYYHADNSKNQTFKGTPLDIDSRHPKIIRIGLETYIRCVERALEKHKEVICVAVPGNHDTDSAAFMQIALDLYFSKEPRVTVLCKPGRFHYYKFGRNLFMFTHGDTCKLKELAGIMAADCKEWWAETDHRYCHTGHVHHRTIEELLGGVMVETHRTLASPDGWHTAQGYRSGRDMVAIRYDAEHGEDLRFTVSIGRIKDEIRKAR